MKKPTIETQYSILHKRLKDEAARTFLVADAVVSQVEELRGKGVLTPLMAGVLTIEGRRVKDLAEETLTALRNGRPTMGEEELYASGAAILSNELYRVRALVSAALGMS